MSRLCRIQLQPAQPFPAEITDYMLDYLWNDPCTLKNCSLVCRVWLATTRYHLFTTIRIRSSDDCRRFYELLTATSPLPNADLTGYVRRLVFEDMPFQGLDVHEAAAAFRKLYKVESLELLHWSHDDLPEDFIAGFAHAFPNVKGLVLSCVEWKNPNDLVQLLRSLPRLSQISVVDHLQGCYGGFLDTIIVSAWKLCENTFQDEASEHSDSPEAERTVEITHLKLSDPLYAQWFLECFRRPPFRLRVEYLDIRWPFCHEQMVRLMELLRKSGVPLKQLSLFLMSSGNVALLDHITPGVRNLRVSELEFLKVGCVIMDHRPEFMDYQISWMWHILDHVNMHAKHLRSVRFRLAVRDNIKELFWLNMGSLDHVLHSLVQERPWLQIVVDVPLLDPRTFKKQVPFDVVQTITAHLPQFVAACSKTVSPMMHLTTVPHEQLATVYFNFLP